MNYCSAKKLRAALGFLTVAALPLFMVAQTAPATPAGNTDDSVLKLEKYQVTGSYIPIAGATTAIPVTVLDAKAIADTGINSDVLEILRKAAPQFAGNGNLGSSNANISGGATGGGSALAFRNTATLVLINGRRSASAPVAASGGFTFVDVNQIPVSAIDRIEILQDGASALYGTDAVAGVVNIIMKTNFKGMEAGLNFGFSTASSNYATRKGWVVTGAENEKTAITVSAEWFKSDPLFQEARNFSNPSFGTPTFAGVIDKSGRFFVLNSSLNAPPLNLDLSLDQLVAQGIYQEVDANNLISGLGAEKDLAFNLAEFVTLLLGNERRSATFNLEHKLNDRLTVFGDVMYSMTKTFSQINAQPTNATIAASDPFNPGNVSIRARNRFLDHPRQFFNDTTTIRGLIGLRGHINEDWDFETGALKNRIDQQFRNEGLIDTNARIAAVAAGAVNYFAREQAPGAVEASGIFGTALGTGVSDLTNYDFRVTGKLFELPAGPVGIAAGSEYRTESLSQSADRNSQSATFGWDSATTLDPFEKGRNVWSYFANVRVPILGSPGGKGRLLEVEGALRYENYSDTSNPTVPKVGFRFLPFDDQFALRGSYSESFSAPTLFQLFGPGGIGFTSPLGLDKFGGGTISGQANARSGANPDLAPSGSKNYSFGFVWSPKALKGFSVAADYFRVKQTGLISTIGSETILQDVELNGASSPFAQFVRLGSDSNLGLAGFTGGAAVTAPGQIGNRSIDTVYVTDTLVNIASQKLSGIDFKVNYVWNSDTLGRFDAQISGIWWNEYKATTLPGTATFDTVGKATNFNGTIPDYQTQTSIHWSKGQWNGALGWQYIPSVNDENAFDEADPTANTHVGAYNSIDLNFAYRFDSKIKILDGVTVRFGANNIFDKQPPSAKGTFTQSNADIATYSPVGRLWFIEAKYNF